MKAVSLRFRITAWYVSLLAAALVAFGASVYFGLESYLKSSLQHSLASEATAITTSFLSHEDAKGVPWLVGEVVEAYAPESSGRFIRITRIVDDRGSVLYQSGNSHDPYIDASRIPHTALRPPASFFRREYFNGSGADGGSPDNHSIVVYTLPYVSPSGTHFLVETGASPAPVDHLLRSLLITLLLLTPLILLAAAFGGHLLMTRPLRPVAELTEQAEHVGTGGTGERLQVIPTGDELERLSLSLNRMISRLEDALNHNRRFSADVSHELRTPLTILRGELEHVAQLPNLALPVNEAVESALEEIDRMSKIVESLLAISRLDSGGDRMQRAPVDIEALAQSTIEQMGLLAEEYGVSLKLKTANPLPENFHASNFQPGSLHPGMSAREPSALVLGDPLRLKQVLVNLLDNATKYTRSGGEVLVSISADSHTVLLEVRDNGIGIPAASLPFVFDRFYRADKARSRQSGGTGLGLSIVKAICNAHEAAVTVESVEGEGTTVRVEMPRYFASNFASNLASNLPGKVAGAQQPESSPEAHSFAASSQRVG